MKVIHYCPLGLLSAALAACGGSSSSGGEAKPFNYATTVEKEVAIEVRIDGEPAPYARVTVCRALPPFDPEAGSEATATETYLNALTNAEGRVEAAFVTPTQVGAFDVIVQVPGASGPFDYPKHAEIWGPFAPSSRQRVTAQQLTNLDVSLIGD